MGLLLESKLSQLFDEQLNKSINLFDSMTKLMQTKEFEKKAENDTQTSLSKLSDTYNMKTKKNYKSRNENHGTSNKRWARFRS